MMNQEKNIDLYIKQYKWYDRINLALIFGYPIRLNPKCILLFDSAIHILNFCECT